MNQTTDNKIAMDFSGIPAELKRKIRRYISQQGKKHRQLTDEQLIEKAGKKFNIKFEYS